MRLRHVFLKEILSKMPGTGPSSWSGFAREALLYLLCGTVAVAPLLQGLYAARERYVTMAVVLLCAVAILAFLRTAKSMPVVTIVGAGVVLLYALGVATPASASGAITGFVSMAAYMAAFWAWSAGEPSEREKLLLGGALVWSSLLIAVWGLLEHVGVKVADAALGDRLAVGFGYPNATASLLGLGFVLAVMLQQKSLSWTGTSALTFASVPIGAALILTGSRGAWLAVAVALGVGLVARRKLAAGVLGQSITLGVASLVAAIVVLVQPTVLTLASVMVAAFGFGLISGLARTFIKFAGLWLTLLGLACGAYFTAQLWQGNNYTLANHSEVDAWKVIQFDVSRELLYSQVAFTTHISALNPGEKPFAGQLSIWATEGERATQRLYFEVLLQGERALELPLAIPDKAEGVRIVLVNLHAHTRVTMQNPRFRFEDGREYVVSDLIFRLLPHPLAVRAQGLRLERIVEDGRRQFIDDALVAARKAPLFGRGGGTWQAVYSSVQSNLYATARVHSDYFEVLLDTGAVGLFLYSAFLAIAFGTVLLSEKSSPVDIACAVGALTVFVHSGWEALLSFPSLYLGAFSLLGAVQVRFRRVSRGMLHRAWVGLVTLCCAGFLLALSLAAAEVVAARGDREDALVRAITLNPWHPAWQVELAELKASRVGERDATVTTLYEAAQELEPYSALYASHLGQHYARAGNLIGAVDALVGAIDLQPMNVVHYSNAARVAAHTAEAFYFTSLADAQRYAHKVLDVYSRLTQVLHGADEAWLRQNPSFRLTPAMGVDVGRALAVLNQPREAWRYLMLAADGEGSSLFEIANPWLDRLFGYTYRPREARNLLPTQVSIVERNQGFLSHRAALQPDSVLTQVGAASLRGEATGDGLYGIGTQGFVSVRAGQVYTASVYLRHAPARPILLRIDWFSDTDRTGFAHGSYVVADDSWQRLAVTGVAPENTTRLRLFVLTDNSAKQGETLWVDAWMVERGSSASPWAPGQFR